MEETTSIHIHLVQIGYISPCLPDICTAEFSYQFLVID